MSGSMSIQSTGLGHDETSRKTAAAGEPEIEVLFVNLWPDAGMALGFRSRTATYRAAAAGHIEVTRFGKLQRVSKRWLERKASGEAA